MASLFSGSHKKPKSHRAAEKKKEQENKTVDDILDKISKHGMNSLTSKEKQILNDRSKKN